MWRLKASACAIVVELYVSMLSWVVTFMYMHLVRLAVCCTLHTCYRIGVCITINVPSVGCAASRQSFYSMDVQQVPQGMGSGFIWDQKVCPAVSVILQHKAHMRLW